MKKEIILLLAACLFFNTAAAPVSSAAPKSGVDLFKLSGADKDAINIHQAVEMAMSSNSDILIAQKTAQIYEEQVRQYWSYVYPQLSISGNYTRALQPQEAITSMGKFRFSLDNATSATAEATLLLWAGGAVSAGIKMGKMFEQSGAFQLSETKNKIRDLVTTLCFGIVLSHALIQVQQENLNIAKDHLKEIQAKYKQGLASDLDVLNQKVKVSNSEPPLIQAKNSYEVGLLTLRRLLNKDVQDSLSLTWKIEDVLKIKTQSLEELYDSAAQFRPELVVARLNRDIAKEHINIARAEHWGEISAFANAAYAGSSDKVLIPMSSDNSSYGASAGIKFSLPLFEGFRVDSAVKQKQLAYDQAQISYQDARRNIRIEVKKAWLNFNEAKQRIVSTQGTIDQARKNLAQTNIRYRNGLASRLDLDDSSLLLYNAELQFVQAVHDAFVALSALNYAVGKEVILK